MIGRIVEPILVGIFAARVANHLISLGIDVNKLDKDCADALWKIEHFRRKEFNPREAAVFFYGIAFGQMPDECFILNFSRSGQIYHVDAIIREWAVQGKIREVVRVITHDSLKAQL